MTGRAPLPVALVGAGGIGRAYAEVFAASELARCVAVTDVDTAAAEAFADQTGCAVAPDIAAVADVADLGAVVLCTPPVTHPDLAVHLLERGIPVLCEKPLAITPSAARQIVDAAATSGTPLSVATKFRFVREMAVLRELLDGQQLGEVILVENAFTAAVDMTRRWNTDPAISGGGVLADNGPHSFDLLLAVFGPIDELIVVEGRRTQSDAVEDTVVCHARSLDGVPAVVDLTWTVDKKLDDYLRVWGTRGAVRLGWRRSMAQTNRGEWEEIGRGYQKVEAMRGAFDAFLASIRGDGPAVLAPADLLATVDTVAAGYQSLESGGWAKVGGRGS